MLTTPRKSSNRSMTSLAMSSILHRSLFSSRRGIRPLRSKGAWVAR